MRHKSKTEFAKLAGISRQTLYTQISLGNLIVGKTGKLDICNVSNKEYLSSKGVVLKNGKISGKNKSKSLKNKDNSSQVGNKKNEKSVNPEYLNNLPSNLNILSSASANKLKTIEQIRQYQVKTDEARKVLIHRDSVQKVFSELYMIDVNQFRTLGANVSPDIAALVGSDDSEIILKISELIDEEVFKILKQIKRLLNDFLKNQKIGEING